VSKTGVYKYDPKVDKVVKISDRTPHVTFDDVSLPPRRNSYYSPNLGCEIHSRRHKRDVLRQMGLVEVPDRGAAASLVREDDDG
jgi:hypothetical protein